MYKGKLHSFAENLGMQLEGLESTLSLEGFSQ